jgi:hypothetical protein
MAKPNWSVTIRLPSIKTLSAVFGDNAKTAREILELTKTAGKLAEYPSVEHARKTAYSPHSRNRIKLLALDDLGQFYGVESIETSKGDECADYLNTGDTYAETLILWRGTYRVQTLGDFIEKARVKFK